MAAYHSFSSGIRNNTDNYSINSYNITTKESVLINYIHGNIYNGKFCTRDGREYYTAPNYDRAIGQNMITDDAGENLCIPFQQSITVSSFSDKYALHPIETNNGPDGNAGGFPEWYFDSKWGDFDASSGPRYMSNLGFFGVINHTVSSSHKDPNSNKS
jgi:hypothetical protein